MKKFSTLLFLLALVGFLFQLPVYAKEHGDDTMRVIRDNEKLGEKARVVFLAKCGKRKLVFIRLTPSQWATQKVRSKVKRRGIIRIVLRARQQTLITKILKEEGLTQAYKKIMVRVPAKVAKKRGLKSLYVVRPLKLFTKKLDQEYVDNVYDPKDHKG